MSKPWAIAIGTGIVSLATAVLSPFDKTKGLKLHPRLPSSTALVATASSYIFALESSLSRQN